MKLSEPSAKREGDALVSYSCSGARGQSENYKGKSQAEREAPAFLKEIL